MAVVAMTKIEICAMKRDRKAVLELLQSMGCVEINKDLKETDLFRKTDTLASRTQYRKRVANTEKALDILNKYFPEKTSLFSSMDGKKDTDDTYLDKIIAKRHWYNTMVSGVLELERMIEGVKADIARYKVNIEGLKPWEPMDIPINTYGTEKTAFVIGSMPPALNEEGISTMIAKRAPALKGVFDISVVSSDSFQTNIVGICMKEDEALFREALRAEGFTAISFFSHRTPVGKQEKYTRDIARLENETQELLRKLSKYQIHRQDFRILADYYRIRGDKYEVLGKLLQSGSTFIVTGAVPSDKAEALKDLLEDRFEISVELSAYAENEEAPVLLHNEGPLNAGEGILESYGLPGKKEIDPTKITTFCYIFLFGLMLSDAMYGFLVFTVCLVLLKKFPKMEDSMHKSLKLFMYCGLSTLFWGVLFGGYFGDAVNVVSRVFFEHEVSIPPLWFEPIKDPMKLLVVSLAIGVAHLFLGLIMKAYMLIKNKDIVGAISDSFSWMMLVSGLILMLIPTSMFASILGKQIVFPEFVNYLAIGLVIAGALILILMTGRKSRNVGVRLAKGFYELYNITGWLSDILSYSRLLALGLATGVIAQVVNQMGSMVGKSVFGVIVFILVFILGHTLNMAINLLGAYVHTSRLQYVEFFGKFYDGSGRKFKPFRSETKYINIKQNKK